MITKVELETFLIDGDAIDHIKDVLAGKGRLIRAFVWGDSPQGFNFWNDRDDNGLDDEARAILQEWVDVWEGRKPAGDDVLHSEAIEAAQERLSSSCVDLRWEARRDEPISAAITQALRSMGYDVSAVGILQANVEWLEQDEGDKCSAFVLTISGGAKDAE